MLEYAQKLPWKGIFLLSILLLFEVSMHPLGIGPDRRIHDPGVARFLDPHSYPGDWYADAVQASGVYPFYGALIGIGDVIGIGEERWRMFLYIACLVVTYSSLLRIARVFTDNILVIPILVVLHAAAYLYDPPAWLYGPFIHVDGGFAPRSLGVAFSFLAIALALEKKVLAPWIVLGLATLIHVSNSLLIFLLLLFAKAIEWIIAIWREESGVHSIKQKIRNFTGRIALAALAYVLSGGWFVLAVAIRDAAAHTNFPAQQFIWIWTYFRAPYMALPEISHSSWLIFFLLIGAGVVSGAFLYFSKKYFKKPIVFLGSLGGGALLGFGFFYLTSFVYPWLTGFQLYSFRIVYIFYFVAYLFIVVALISFPSFCVEKLSGRFIFLRNKKVFVGMYTLILGSIFIWGIDEYKVLDKYLERAQNNIVKSYRYLLNPGFPELESSIQKFLLEHRSEAYLAPPNWYGPPQYTSHVASFKVFGFTQASLPIWYERMDALSYYELSKTYNKQFVTGKFKTTTIDWKEKYDTLSTKEIEVLQKKYKFRYFITTAKAEYPFTVLIREEDQVLYDLSF